MGDGSTVNTFDFKQWAGAQGLNQGQIGAIQDQARAQVNSDMKAQGLKSADAKPMGSGGATAGTHEMQGVNAERPDSPQATTPAPPQPKKNNFEAAGPAPFARS